MEVPVNMLKVVVTFNPDNIGTGPIFTFSGDVTPVIIAGLEFMGILVPQGIGFIVFTLTTAPTSTVPPPPSALFQTSPIQWLKTLDTGLKSGSPTESPGMFMIQRLGDHDLTLIDFNSNPLDSDPAKNHWFNLVVIYNGNTYGSDPVIINEPPDS